jgi:hypothetical protein
MPCNLDSGISGYPRVSGEGLACYFARILGEQIQGFQGKDAFGTVASPGFVQPAVSATVVVPMTTVDCYDVGQLVWNVAGGFYEVASVDSVGVTLTLKNLYGTLYNLTSGATIPAGTKVLSAGAPASAGPQGIQGPQGAVGPTGPAGAVGAASYAVVNHTGGFVQPAVASTVTVTVNNVVPFAVGEGVWVAGGGFYLITDLDTNALTLTLENLFDFPVNSLAGVVIVDGAKIVASGATGPQGPVGTLPVQTWNFGLPGSYGWTCPAGVTSVRGKVWGGGGGGSGSASTTNGGHEGYGGGGAEYADLIFPVTAGSIYAVVVGAGGAGGSGGGSGAVGSVGAASSISNPGGGSVIISGGGGGAGGDPSTGPAGSAGTGGLGTADHRFSGYPGLVQVGGNCGSGGAGGLAASTGNTPGGGGGGGAATTDSIPVVVTSGIGRVILAAHGLTEDQPVIFTGSGVIPTGWSASTTYYLVSVTPNSFYISASVGGPILVASSAGTTVVMSTVGRPGGAGSDGQVVIEVVA